MPGSYSAPDYLPLIAISRESDVPLHRQLADGLREAIVRGALSLGARLPSTRALAAQLRVARNTVIAAYDQLYAEGYTEARIGSGTRVISALPEDVVHPPRTLPLPAGAVPRPALTWNRPQSGWLFSRESSSAAAFSVGVPALDEFPFHLWSRLAGRRLRGRHPELFDYGDRAGYGPLRRAIVEHVGVTRGIRCLPEQVIVTLGSQQAVDIAVRLTVGPWDAALIEDPCYPVTRDVLAGIGVRAIPVPVDLEGMRVADPDLRGGARMAYVTPSHQFPLGVSMTWERRLALLDWARKEDAWIVEDDYDNAYRHAGVSIPALYGMDESERVLYIGSFSTVLYPGLRLGYLIAPRAVAEQGDAMRASLGGTPPAVLQATLSDFMNEGHFRRHIRRMRAVYAQRRHVLLDAIAMQLSGVLEVVGTAAGLHLTAFLPTGFDDVRLAAAARSRDISVLPLSPMYMGPSARSGLVLGYGAADGDRISAGVGVLTEVLRDGSPKP